MDIADGNAGRSLYAYMANPESERAKYATDTDKEMTVLKFKRASDGKNTGILTWYPVHGTSMLGNNTHVSGDNKGVAAVMFEKEMANDASAAEGFVAGFSQANVGDTTPNVLGAWSVSAPLTAVSGLPAVINMAKVRRRLRRDVQL